MWPMIANNPITPPIINSGQTPHTAIHHKCGSRPQVFLMCHNHNPDASRPHPSQMMKNHMVLCLYWFVGFLEDVGSAGVEALLVLDHPFAGQDG